jgi:LL-diaminopimelate aminotransferase
LPLPNDLPIRPFVIYLCSPNNPTGAVFSREDLQKWVNFALLSGSLIIFDAAYESFIADKGIPHSIFEIKGAKECAIEVCSFSKMAGFTGIRCGWTVISSGSLLHDLWARRQATKFNGASYIAQMGAIAALSDEGERETSKNVLYYMENARILADFLRKKGISFCGGVHAPYLWVECPKGLSSWEIFDILLTKFGIVCTPGAGFGRAGEDYFRLSSFGTRDDINEAIIRTKV